MKILSKKSISLVLIFTLLIAIFMPTMVSATTTIQQGNKIVNTTTSETLIIEGREHNSTIYAGEIKKDGVTLLNYLYSDDVTRSSVLFDNIRKALSNPYSDLVPSIISEETESGLKELSVSTLNGVDLTTITSGWTNASNIATQIYNGTNTDIVNSNMYDVDNGFKTEVDANETERTSIDNPVENNKRIISHLGTQTYDSVSFTVDNGNLMEVHNVDLKYLSEATTVIYTSVNVATETTPATPTKINTLNISIASPKVGDTATETTKPSVTIENNKGYKLDCTQYLTKPETEGGIQYTGAFEEEKDYYVEVSLEANENYNFASSDDMTLKVNGKTTDYTINNSPDGSRYFLFYAKVQATAEEETTTTETTYEYIEGANQTYTIGEDGATFRINADYSLFENGGKVYVDDILVSADNYTSKSGSTIITFTKDYMSSLSEGEHTLKVVFNDGGSTTTKFTVAKADTTTDTETTAEEKTTTTTSNNPKTGDNIVIWISLMIVSILGVAGTVKFVKKNK